MSYTRDDLRKIGTSLTTFLGYNVTDEDRPFRPKRSMSDDEVDAHLRSICSDAVASDFTGKDGKARDSESIPDDLLDYLSTTGLLGDIAGDDDISDEDDDDISDDDDDDIVDVAASADDIDVDEDDLDAEDDDDADDVVLSTTDGADDLDSIEAELAELEKATQAAAPVSKAARGKKATPVASALADADDVEDDKLRSLASVQPARGANSNAVTVTNDAVTQDELCKVFIRCLDMVRQSGRIYVAVSTTPFTEQATAEAALTTEAKKITVPQPVAKATKRAEVPAADVADTAEDDDVDGDEDGPSVEIPVRSAGRPANPVVRKKAATDLPKLSKAGAQYVEEIVDGMRARLSKRNGDLRSHEARVAYAQKTMRTQSLNSATDKQLAFAILSFVRERATHKAVEKYPK